MKTSRAKPKGRLRNRPAKPLAELRKRRDEFVRAAEVTTEPVDETRLRSVLALLDT